MIDIPAGLPAGGGNTRLQNSGAAVNPAPTTSVIREVRQQRGGGDAHLMARQHPVCVRQPLLH